MFKEYVHYDAMGLAELVRTQEVTSLELLEAAIERANLLNPSLNAIVHRFDKRAQRACAQLPEGPFKGVPFLLKNLNHLFADEPITFGSRGIGFVPDYDSELVKRFKATGVNIFGKTNTPEFGLIITTEPKAHGPTHNPHKRDYSSGGSSGGSAAAVAAGIVPFASADDGGGSIRFPAAWSGTFGLKPSRGLTPHGPDYGEGWEGAIAGLIVSRSVRDSATMLDHVAGGEIGGPYQVDRGDIGHYYTASQADPKPLKIALSRKGFVDVPLNRDVAVALEKTAQQLRDLGHEVIECEPELERDTLWMDFLTIVFAHTAAMELRVKNQFGIKAVRQLEPNTRNMAMIGRAISAPALVVAKEVWHRTQLTLGQFLQEYDLMLCPTVPTPAVKHAVLPPTGIEEVALGLANKLPLGKLLLSSGLVKHFAGPVIEKMTYVMLGNVTGLPAMSVPLHQSSEGLPIGMQFYGPMLAEATLLSLAGQLERANLFQPFAFEKSIK